MDSGAAKLEPSLYKLLARKKQELIEVARSTDDPKKKADAEARIRWLVRLREEVESSIHPYPEQTVFISYSENTGKAYLSKIRPIAERYGFEVVTGFDRPEGENVLRTVKKLLEDASVYLGLLTPEYTIRSLGGSGSRESRTAPSVWIMEEKGMAIALNKPVRLLIESTVHPDFWKRTTPDRLHNVFTSLDFEEQADIAMLSLFRRYEEMLIRRLYESAEADNVFP